MAKKNKNTSSATPRTPEKDTPAQAFTRLASGRTNKAIKSIGLIAQLTGSSYESTPEQRNAIVLALEASVQHVKDSFDGRVKSSDKFKLPE